MLNETLSPSTRWSASTMSVFLSPSGMSLTDAQFQHRSGRILCWMVQDSMGNSNSLVHNPQHPFSRVSTAINRALPLARAAIPVAANRYMAVRVAWNKSNWPVIRHQIVCSIVG